MEDILSLVKVYSVEQIKMIPNLDSFTLLKSYFELRDEAYFNKEGSTFYFFVIKKNTKVIGVMGLEFLAKYDACYISPLEILPEYRNMGRGTQLLDIAKMFISFPNMFNLNRQYDTGCNTKAVFLKCETSELIKFYLKRGFSIDNEYTSKENGIVMKCTERFGN